VHRINRNLLPTADQVMELIRSRRTNRTMTSRPVPQEAIDKIVEAGYYAPTAENTRLVRIGYVSSPEKLQEIRDFVFDAWGSVAEKMHDAEEWARLKSAHPDYAHVAALYHNLKRSDAKGLDPILRHVTTVVAYAAEPGYEYGDKDCNLAYQNSSLIAEALGISQVYLGFVCGAMKYGDKDRLARILGVEGEIHALMGIGVPAMRYTNYVERGPYQSLVEVGA
jgi:nitroreductase